MIIVNDKMQSGYIYKRICPQGKEFAKEFKPELSPEEMLKMGVFEGKYLCDCKKEFPASWFDNAKLSPLKPDASLNFFGVKSRQSLQIWRDKGWILEPDPRGWFQWYCRYYMGRRIESVDKVQIKRWKSFRRHQAQVIKNCIPMDIECRAKQRQALLQWAYNPLV
ncbi:MAG: hypothetical protein R3Y43_02165 [Alphaproteobacteria bacterium]